MTDLKEDLAAGAGAAGKGRRAALMNSMRMAGNPTGIGGLTGQLKRAMGQDTRLDMTQAWVWGNLQLGEAVDMAMVKTMRQAEIE